jgi:hypothetical protein
LLQPATECSPQSNIPQGSTFPDLLGKNDLLEQVEEQSTKPVLDLKLDDLLNENQLTKPEMAACALRHKIKIQLVPA